MTSLVARWGGPLGNHQRVNVYAGPDRDNREPVGTLLMTEDEGSALITRVNVVAPTRAELTAVVAQVLQRFCGDDFPALDRCSTEVVEALSRKVAG